MSAAFPQDFPWICSPPCWLGQSSSPCLGSARARALESLFAARSVGLAAGRPSWQLRAKDWQRDSALNEQLTRARCFSLLSPQAREAPVQHPGDRRRLTGLTGRTPLTSAACPSSPSRGCRGTRAWRRRAGSFHKVVHAWRGPAPALSKTSSTAGDGLNRPARSSGVQPSVSFALTSAPALSRASSTAGEGLN